MFGETAPMTIPNTSLATLTSIWEVTIPFHVQTGTYLRIQTGSHSLFSTSISYIGAPPSSCIDSVDRSCVYLGVPIRSIDMIVLNYAGTCFFFR